jgi:glycosyltransferase involved in cell wall biosynthesis
VINSRPERRPPLRVLLATPYGEDGMGGIDRLNDAIVNGYAARPELGIKASRLVTRGKGSLALAQPIFAAALAKLTFQALRGEVDLLHIHLSVKGSSYRKAVLARAARALQVPYAVHLHGTDYREFWEGTNGALRAEIDRMFVNAAKIIVLGEFWAGVVRDMLPEVSGKIIVLPNATAGVVRPAEPAGAGEPVRITFLGQLGQRKGTPDFVAALGRLRGLSNWRATIAGDGAIAETKEQLRALDLEGRVSVPGWLDAAERTQLLHQSDMLVLPSYAENLPMVLLEAFAHGVATIITPVGAVPEVVSHNRNGLLVDPGDVTGIAAAMERLISNREFSFSLGQAARRDHTERFEIGQYLERLAGIWQEAAPVSAGRRALNQTARRQGGYP